MAQQFPHPVPEESYSRALDKEVQQNEMPYGYDNHYEMPVLKSEKPTKTRK